MLVQSLDEGRETQHVFQAPQEAAGLGAGDKRKAGTC